jgi:hypothetical protein
MKKNIFLVLSFLLSNARAEDIHKFAKDIIQIVEKSPGGDPLQDTVDNPVKFFLEEDKADLVLSYSKVNHDLRMHEGSITDKIKPCPEATILASLTHSTNIAPHVGILLSETSDSFDGSPSNASAAVVAVRAPPPLIDQIMSQLLANPQNWEEILSINKDKLTSDQKISLISQLGSYFSNRYNFARADNKDSTGFVSIEQLLTSVKSGTSGGVCRDIALAQTQMMNALGFKDSYVVTFKAYKGSHATAISVDPTTGKIVKFNYGEVTSAAKGSGTEALVQDTTIPDQGLAFKIYDSKGKPAVQLPSELGQILKETSGGEDREFNAKNYSLGKVGFDKNGIQGNLFTGKTSSGENISGVAIGIHGDLNPNIKAHLGVSASSVKGERSVNSISADNLYLNAGADYSADPKHIGSVAIGAIAGAEMGVLRTDFTQHNRASGLILKGEGETDIASSGYLGVRTEAKLKNGKTVIENQTYINLYPDFGHVASADSKVVAVNSVVVDTKLTQQLSSADQAALLRSAVVFRTYGASLVAEVGYENKAAKSSYFVGFRTPLSEQPTFLPGGTTSGYARASKEVLEGITLNIELEESKVNGSTGTISVEGKFD